MATSRITCVAIVVFFAFFLSSRHADSAEDDVLDLGEIVVTGTRTPHVLEEVPVQTRVITREQIEKSGVQKAADLLRNIPGIQISGGAPGAVSSRSTALLRGLPAQYTLVLLDGNRIKSEHVHTGVNLNLIPVDLIERIEIVEGPASSLYGGDAMGGVINIITRGEKSEPGTEVRLSAGNHESLQGNATAFFPLGLSHNVLSLTRSESNGVRSQWFDRDTVFWKWRAETSKNRSFDLSFEHYDGNFYRPTASSGSDRRQTISAGFVAKTGNDATVSARFSENQYGNTNPRTNDDTTGALVTFSTPTGRKNVFTGGIEYRKDDFERVSSPRHDQTVKGIFLQDEYGFGQRFSVAAAVRADDYPGIGTELTPNLSLLYYSTPGTAWRFSAARGFRAPSLQDKFEYHYNHGTYIRDGNPDLQPEISMSWSLGFERQVSQKALLRLSLYRDDFKDMIVVLPTGTVDPATNLDIRRRENIADAYTMGLTTEMRLRVSESFSLNIGYSHLKTRDETTGRQLDYTPKNSFTFMTEHSFGKWRLNLRGEGVTGRVYRVAKKIGVYSNMDDYFTLGGNLSRSIGAKSECFITIENIFNEAYETFEEGSQPSQFERSYYFGVRHAF